MLPERSDNRLPRAQRLRGASAVSELFASGESNFAYPIRYVVLNRDQCELEDVSSPIEVMFSVPKRFHRRANKRNLLRRRLKEAYRLGRGEGLRLDRLKHPLRVAMIYSTKEVLEYGAFERAMAKIFLHLNEKYCSE